MAFWNWNIGGANNGIKKIFGYYNIEHPIFISLSFQSPTILNPRLNYIFKKNVWNHLESCQCENTINLHIVQTFKPHPKTEEIIWRAVSAKTP